MLPHRAVLPPQPPLTASHEIPHGGISCSMQNWVAIHITAGLLPRGSEDTIVKVYNTAQVLRVVFIINGRVAIVFEYNKSHAANNHLFLNVRYLPSNLGTLVFNYLAYIRPFADFLCIWIGLPYLRCNEFLFQNPRKKPKHLSFEQATAILRRLTSHFTAPMTISLYRHGPPMPYRQGPHAYPTLNALILDEDAARE